jgi:anti-anti-sigma factor
MAPSGSLPLPVSGRAPPWAGVTDGPQVVRLSGEYDATTVAAMSRLLSTAIASSDTDLVLDMDEVCFVDAVGVGVILRARAFLQLRSRSLTLRTPSAAVRAMLEICDLDGLIEPEADDAVRLSSDSGALESWVVVRRRRRGDRWNSACQHGRS